MTNTVSHLNSTNKHQHTEDKLTNIAPDHVHSTCVRVNRRRCRHKRRIDDARKNNDSTLKTHGSIRFDKAFADA